MASHSRPGSLQTIYAALYLGWGVVPLMFALTLLQQPNPANLATVLYVAFAAAWWVCGLGLATGFRWLAWPAMAVVFIAWAAISNEMAKAVSLLLNESQARLTWEDVGYRAMFFLLPLSVLLVLGWMTRPGRERRTNPGPDIGRLM